MAQKPNITKLYDKIFAVREMLTEAVNTAMEAANDAEAFGGEVSRIVTGQLRQGLLPMLQQYVDDESNQASMASIIKFLDSVPLAWVRTGPEQLPGTTTGSDMISGAGDPADNQAVGQPQQAPPQNPTAPSEPVMESAILKSKDESLREVLREKWTAENEEQPIEEGALDFRNFVEGYVADPLPSQLKASEEDRIYKRALESASKPKATRRLDEDILGGAYASDPNNTAEGMKDWRKLMDDTDEKIDSALKQKLVRG
jgi:hypothetical protein